MKKIGLLTLAAILATGITAGAEQKLPQLIDLGAHKCMACQKMTPVLDELKKEYAGSLEVKFVDVWKRENEATARKYRIRLIPTQIFISAEGKELWRHEGFISKKDILKKWEELEIELKPVAGTKTEAASGS